MPDLQERAREDLSSDGGTNSFEKDGMYDDGEPWGSKELLMKQIINGKPSGIFPNNIPTLYVFSCDGYRQVGENPDGVGKNACKYLDVLKDHLWQCKLNSQGKSDFYQVQE